MTGWGTLASVVRPRPSKHMPNHILTRHGSWHARTLLLRGYNATMSLGRAQGKVQSDGQGLWRLESMERVQCPCLTGFTVYCTVTTSSNVHSGPVTQSKRQTGAVEACPTPDPMHRACCGPPPRLENTDIVANPFFLILCNTLRNPRYVSYFLCTCQSLVVVLG